MKDEFDVIVCGAGHAGIEAALAAARCGARTALVTGNLDTIGQMSCNPAIGGVAKGQIVREIDALGGEMAINADVTGIQFRLLNASKGPAVQSPRAQCDKKAYQFRIKHTLESCPNLHIFQGSVEELVTKSDRVQGCITALGQELRGSCVVITSGTFLRGITHVGERSAAGGRMGEASFSGLSASISRLGIQLERLKTGTPPRVLGRTLCFSQMQKQSGDERPTFFAFHDTRSADGLFHVEREGFQKLGWLPGVDQVPCWITYTTPATRSVVLDNLTRSAMYSGSISGRGPRYCPSIEDKFVRFADKERHTLFLEPEGRNTDEYYINGLSTSLPYAVQVEMVHSVPGLEKAHILRPAYAVEYDFAPPVQLRHTLESKLVENLFFAGQINGTSGYEEAAGQGIIAGINAARKADHKASIVLARHEAYIGVMIDDLVTKGTNEPYRMFTSRAEHRLLLNHGSAEIRLLAYAQDTGAVPAARVARIKEKHARIERWVALLERAHDRTGNSLAERIRAGTTINLPAEFKTESSAVQEEVLYRVTYSGYIERELRQVNRLTNAERVRIPEDFDYSSVRGLKKESMQKLSAIRPETLGRASRVSGVNPTDIAILLVALSASRSG